MVKYDCPMPRIDGVEVKHVPVFRKEDYSPEQMAKCVSVLSAQSHFASYLTSYTDVSRYMQVVKPRFVPRRNLCSGH
jgi:hypothetical protein